METIKNYVETNKERFLEELFDLIRIPSISAIAEARGDMLKTAEYVRESLTASTTLFWDEYDYLEDDRNDEGYGIRCGLFKPLGKTLTTKFTTEYRKSKYTDPDEEVDLFTLGGSLDYTYHRFLISLGYIYRRNDSDRSYSNYTSIFTTCAIRP